MRGRLFKQAELPAKLLRAVQGRLRKPGFNSYNRLAEWIRQQGGNISISSLKRLGTDLARARRPTRSVRTRRAPRSWGGTSEGLMKLAQEKLGSTLAEIHQFKEGDMSRLAHAVAHLTQAGISLQRWNERVNQGAFERERVRPEGKSKFRGGLSAETSQALRNALLGIAPFDEERTGRQEPAPDQRETSAFPETQTAGGVEKHEEPSRTVPAAPLKGSESSDRQDERIVRGGSTPVRS